MRKKLFVGVLLICFVARPAALPSEPGLEALNWAFRFASALEADPTDQTRAQAGVVRDYATMGQLAAATNAVEKILDWRRVTAWADIATELAWASRIDEAMVALQRAEELLPGVRGDWQPTRAAAHVAVALAATGNIEPARVRMRGLPDEEAIKVRVAIAQRLAADGELAAAEEELRPARDSKNFVVLAGVVKGWLAIGKVLTNDLALIQSARDMLIRLPVGKQLELVGDVARALGLAGDHAGAEKLLESVLGLVMVEEPYIRAPAMARLGLAWGDLGDGERQMELLRDAAKVARTGDPMDQPAAAAAVAEALMKVGAADEAWSLLEHGLEVATTFVNARPRVLAIVALCRAIGRQRSELPATWVARLEVLFAGLGDPW